MSREDEIDLSRLILCPKCDTLHKKVRLPHKSSAKCKNCGAILYKYDKSALERSLALAITGFMLFIVANLFPLVRIDLLGVERHVSIISMLFTLVDNSFYVVGLVVAFLVLIFPFMAIAIFILLLLLLTTGVGYELSRELLILLSKVLPWSMLEIYLVSILVALVKLIGVVEIHFGLSFWALTLFVILDIYLSKSIHIGELWELRERVYDRDR